MNLLFLHPPLPSRGTPDEGFLPPGGGVLLPMGIAYLAAVCEEEGHRVKVVDLDGVHLTREELEKEVSSFRPDLIMLSSMTLQYRFTRRLIAALGCHAPVVVGGAHASIFPEEVIKDGASIVVIGEGERTIVEIAQRKDLEDPEEVDGIAFRKGGEVIRTRPRSYISDIDPLPFPAWHLFDLSRYDCTFQGRPGLPMITSRGCPFNCAFCFKGVFGNRIRMRSAKNIVAEISLLRSRFGIGSILFEDDCFTASRQRIHDLCRELIARKIDIVWRCVGRADQVDWETLQLMKKAGCVSIAFGIESGSQKILDLVGKKLDRDAFPPAVRNARRLGIKTKGYYMIGLPWETRRTARETIRFARRNRTDQLQFTLPVPLPGTRLWDMAREKGFPVEKYVESFSWDEERPPYSLSESLSVDEIQCYVRKARNIGRTARFVREFLGMVFSFKAYNYYRILRFPFKLARRHWGRLFTAKG